MIGPYLLCEQVETSEREERHPASELMLPASFLLKDVTLRRALRRMFCSDIRVCVRYLLRLLIAQWATTLYCHQRG